MHPLLDPLREAELVAALRHFPSPPARVLELGAGSGWQSSLLASSGYEVFAVDVEPTGDTDTRVLPIDGVNLPFGSATFDVIFSSNVLEHVVHLDALLAEADRVLRGAGRSVHLMPTPTWRLLTMATFYASLPRRARAWVWSRRRRSAEPSLHVLPTPGGGRGGLARLARAMVVEPPHGEFGSALAEVWHYRRQAWRRRFRGRVEMIGPAGVLYTGYGLLPGLSISSRRWLARWLGSSCLVYVVRPTHRE